MRDTTVLIAFESPVISQGICTILRAISPSLSITIWSKSLAANHHYDVYISDDVTVDIPPQAKSLIITGRSSTSGLNIYDSVDKIDSALRKVLPSSTSLREAPRELTPQQERVAYLLSQGVVNKKIAQQLQLSEATVRTHITSIFRKLNVCNRTQATNVLIEYFATHPTS